MARYNFAHTDRGWARRELVVYRILRALDAGEDVNLVSPSEAEAKAIMDRLREVIKSAGRCPACTRDLAGESTPCEHCEAL